MRDDATGQVTLHLPSGMGPTPLLAAVIDLGEHLDLDLATSERLVAALGDLMAASGAPAFDARLRLAGGSLRLELVADPEAEVSVAVLQSIAGVFSRLETTLPDGRPGLDAVIDGAG